MKRQIVAAFLILLFLGNYTLASEEEYRTDQVFVRFASVGGEPLSLPKKMMILNGFVNGSYVAREYKIVPGLCLVQLPDGVTVSDAINEFLKSPLILYAEPNYKRYFKIIPNDTMFADLWAMNNTGQTGGTVDADIDAAEAWDIHTGDSDSGIVVAVIDTGIDFSHPDLAANMWVNEDEIPDNGIDDDDNGYVDDINGYDFGGATWVLIFDYDNEPNDAMYHGTHIAGTIGAVGNNAQGVAGVCWDVSIMALKISADDIPALIFEEEELVAIEYAVDNGADIINASFGGYTYSQAEYDAIAAVRDAGILFVASAGNAASNNDNYPHYPSDYDLDNIISVLATDHDDQISDFSNYGETAVDLGAPGEDILSTFPTYETTDLLFAGYNTDYETISGTSMAVPHVVGAAALGWSLLPELSYGVVRDAILETADPLGSLNGLCVTGGRLNLVSMLAALDTHVLNKDTGLMYRKIQEAIGDANTVSGHTLIADKGSEFLDKIYFFETIDFQGKNITLRSGDVSNPLDETIYPERVVISGLGKNTHTVTFSGGEDNSAVLKGFTITEGYATGATIWDKSGGGIYCEGSSPTIMDCIITDNYAVRDGGGIHCEDGSDPNIMNCTISHNTAGGHDGGGIYCFDSSPLIRNCLVVHNRANRDGGGIYFNGPSPSGDPNVINSTIADNLVNVVDGHGGGIYCYWYVDPDINDCIISGNPGYAIFEEDLPSDPQLSYSLFHNNPDGDYYDADTLDVDERVKTGASQINSLPEAGNNYDGDPLYVSGRLGDYYLSHIDSGQFYDSIAVDNGSNSAEELGMHIYSTRTNNAKDDGRVDIGFHYNDPCIPVMFTLETSVSPAGKGSIVPAVGSHSYYQYTHVNLTATESDPDYQFKAWYGTDDDSKKEVDQLGFPEDTQHNVVTMDSDKSVLAEFETKLVSLTVSIVTANGTYELSPPPDDDRRDLYRRGRVVAITILPLNPSHRITWEGTDDDTSRQFFNTVTLDEDKDVYVWLEEPSTLIVGGGGIPGAYTDLQEAIYDAEDGDTIIVHTGTWELVYFDPDQMPPYGGWLDVGFRLRDKAITIRSVNPDDPDTVAATIIHNRFFIDDVGPDTVLAGLTFSDITFTVAWNPADIDCPLPVTDDGEPGTHEFGGAIRIGYDNFWNFQFPDFFVFNEASPTIVNCVIDDIFLAASDGGDSCPNAGEGGWAGKTYGGGIYVGIGCKPVIKNCIISDCNAIGGDGGDGAGYGGNAGEPDDPIWFWGPFDEAWRYTGMGGGAFCDVNSEPKFIGCTFQDNVTQGGSTGIGILPNEHRRIDSFGGAVYCEANSKVEFIDCDFINNMVDTNGFYPLWKWKYAENDPVLPLDEYLAYGGAVAVGGRMDSYEGIPVDFREAEVVFENCSFTGNEATNGGAMYCQHGWESESSTLINKCTFEDNTAFHGGALYSVNGVVQILESTLTNNIATGTVGEGGGVFVFDGFIEITDSSFTANETVASGGGLFLSDSDALLWNCLITDNVSGRDGGGVSVNLYSDCNIVNSTIADNVGGKFGGGLFCGYNSYTHIIDSIIWGNFSVDGHQIAIASDNEYYPEPSVVEISYSDVGPRYALGELVEENGSAGSSGTGIKLIEGQSIYDQIDSTGWAETVVTLAEPVTLKENADWDSPEWVEQLRQEVSRRQQAVLSLLTAGEFTLRYRYDNVAAFSGLVTSEGLNKLLLNPQVKHIEPVRYFNKLLLQSIPLANALTARQEYDGTGVAIAIVDTGIDYRHPMLGGGGFPNEKVIGGYDTGEDDDDPMPVGDAHGTCCAGIAAGNLGNIGDYIGGVAFNAKLYSLKASPDGLGVFAVDAVLAAWDWCLTHRLDDPDNPILVINNSLGGGVADNAQDADLAFPAMAAMAENLTDAGVTILAGSGNDGFAGVGIAYPAALSNVISVGAVYDGTDDPALADQVTDYSNTAWILDILAPADPIYTTDMVNADGYDAGDYFPTFNGTSAACPFAAGVVAGLQSAAIEKMDVTLTPAQVKTVLIASGDPVTDTKIAITRPRVNLGNAVNSLFAGPIYIGENSQIRYDWWDADTMTWDPCSHNLAINDDPLFVEGYYLSQEEAGQDVTSNCVDSGSTDAHTADKYRHTTRTDLVVEDLDSLVDRGYHYIRTTEFKGDLNFDGQVDEDDFFLRLLRHWLDVGCEFPDWCHGTDLNKDGTVNTRDHAIFANNFRKKETVSPEPDPMTWEIYPTSEPGADWARMVATEARDNYGGQIDYYIQRTDEDGFPDVNVLEWDPNRTFVDEGLVEDQKYGYRVKARDARGNETEWSVIGYVIVGLQSPPYAPSNLTAVTSVAVPTSQIDLNWTDNSYDEDGFSIERRIEPAPFAEVATVGADVIDYEDTGLQHSTTYTYRVRAYNQGGYSDYSNEDSATTDTVYEPNEPNMIIGDDDPNSTQYISGNYWYHLVAGEIIDLADGVPLWFRFECTDGAGWQFSSDWIDSTAVFPMVLPHPINPGFPDVVITLEGNIVSYTVAIKEGGAFGWALHWRICASYEADGSNASCSEIILIPPD